MARPVVLRFVGDTSQLTRSFNATAAQSAALSSQIGAMNSKLAATSQTMIAAGATLSRRFTLPITYATGASALLATNFESAMTKIETLAGESRSQVEAWTGAVLDLAKVLPQSPQELAEGLYFIASSGIKAEYALDLLKAAAKSSAVGMGETKVVADALTSAINAYGIENLSASRAADILIAAVREGKGEAEDFAGSIGRTIAPAQLLGVSFDQVAAAMSSMTLVGLSADEAATALRQVFFTLAKPSAQVKKGLDEIGLSAAEVRKSIREQGLLATLVDLREKVAGNDELLSQIFPNIRAFNGLTIMTGENLGNTARLFDIMAGSTGTLDAAFTRTSETSAFKFNTALNKLKLVGMDIGATVLPRLVSNVSAFAETLLRVWNSMSPAAQSMAINIALVVAALGPMLRILGNVGALLSLIAAHPVIAAIIAIGAAFYIAYQRVGWFRDAVDTVVRFLRDNLQSILIAIGSLIASTLLPAFSPIIALAGTLYMLYQRFEPFRNAVDAVARAVMGGLRAAFDWLKVAGPATWEALQSAGRTALQVMQTVAREISAAFSAVKRAVAPVVEWFIKWVGPILMETFGLVGDIVGQFVDHLSNAFDLAVSIAGPFIEQLTSWFELLGIAVQMAMAAAVPWIEGMWQALGHLTSAVGALFDFMKAGFNATWAVVGPILSLIAEVIKTVVIVAFNAVKATIEGFLQVVRGVIQVIRGVITGDWSKAWEGIKNIFGGVWRSITGAVRSNIDTIVGFVSGLPGRLAAFVSGLKDKGLALGNAFIQGIIDGVKGIASAAMSIGKGFTEAMVEALKSGWNKIVDWLNQKTNGIEIDPPGPGPTFGLPDNMWRGLRLADGGIIRGATIAMIGEAGDEAVIPLTRPRRAAQIMQEAGLLPAPAQSSSASSGGRSVVVKQYITALDPYEAARRADTDWQWAMKTSGR